MQWGKRVDALQEIAATGAPVPALANAPVHRPELELYLRCYLDCATDRSFNGRLTFSAVSHWCAVYGVPVADCWDIVRRADDEVHQWQSKSKP